MLSQVENYRPYLSPALSSVINILSCNRYRSSSTPKPQYRQDRSPRPSTQRVAYSTVFRVTRYRKMSPISDTGSKSQPSLPRPSSRYVRADIVRSGRRCESQVDLGHKTQVILFSL